MGKVALVCGLILLVAGIIAGVIITVTRIRTRLAAQRAGLAVRGDLNGRQEQEILALLRNADTLLADMQGSFGAMTSDFTILSTPHKMQVAAWRRAFKTFKEKHLS